MIKGIRFFALIAILLLVTQQNCGFSGFRPGGDGSYSSSNNNLFNIKRSSTRVLPFTTRLTKIRALTGSGDGALYTELLARQNELGSYDFANGVNQELTWSETRIGIWVKAVQPICTSAVMKNKFPYPAAAGTFIKSAYGRDLNEVDNEVLKQLAAASGTNDQKFEVLCTVILSSLEFTTL